jgi:hypothetical protein
MSRQEAIKAGVADCKTVDHDIVCVATARSTLRQQPLEAVTLRFAAPHSRLTEIRAQMRGLRPEQVEALGSAWGQARRPISDGPTLEWDRGGAEVVQVFPGRRSPYTAHITITFDAARAARSQKALRAQREAEARERAKVDRFLAK